MMADLQGVIIKKGVLGANRLSGSDAVSGLIIAAPATTQLQADTPKTIYNLKDAEKLGITAAYDSTKKVVLYRHLAAFYAMAGAGTPLHLLLTSATAKPVDILKKQAQTLLAYANGEIRQLGLAFNPTTAATLIKGLPKNIYDAIGQAQTLYQWAYKHHMPCQIFLEGYGYGGDSAAAADLRKLTGDLHADKVSVVIGQDWDYAEKQDGLRQKYAEVGAALGTCAKAKVHENIGDNEQFNLSDPARKRWIQPGLSSHQLNQTITDDLQTLEDKGYVFGISYTGLAGVHWNNDHVCTPVIVDADNSMNEFTIAYGRTADKATRELYRAYLPKVKTTWQVDQKTGKLSKGTLTALEDLGDQVLEDMIARGEITYGKAIIDSESDLLVERVLNVSFKIVPKGVIGEIKGTLNLKTQQNANQ